MPSMTDPPARIEPTTGAPTGAWRGEPSIDWRRRRAMCPSLRLVSERFEHLRDHAVRMFERDENFRDLCDEYEACSGTVARLESSGLSSDNLRNEYAALMLRLEYELLRYLEEDSRRGDT